MTSIPETTLTGGAETRRGGGEPCGAHEALRYRGVLRRLLQRDYLTHADLGSALQDLARMARDALEAQEGLVALYDAEAAEWSGVTSAGGRLAGPRISTQASLSVLEQVRSTGEALLCTEDRPLEILSDSVEAHQVLSVLAVPLHRWDGGGGSAGRRLWGCLYVHRTVEAEPFTRFDVELLQDVAEVAQRTLNALQHLEAVRSELEASLQRLRGVQEAAAGHYRLGSVTSSNPWYAEHVLGTLQRAATADRVCLLLVGPTGSGKSHLAQAYHYESRRRRGPFIVLDGSQVVSEQTLAAELFGYAPRSGFANAPEKGRLGAAQLADGGTLFIDEITGLPSELQQKLLGLIQTGTYSALGTSEKRTVDLQVIAATNEDPSELLRQRRMREDLLWRIGEVMLFLPPLSRRPEDVPLLAEGFLQRAVERFEKSEITGFEEAALQRLVQHDWSCSGNIRGLEHTVSRSVLLAPPGRRRLRAGDVRFPTLSGDGFAALADPGPRPAAGAASFRAGRLQEAPLARWLQGKIDEHAGVTTAMAADPEVAAALGYPGSMPHSSLQGRLRELGLWAAVAEARNRRRMQQGRQSPGLEAVIDAVREHRSGTEAAKALGINRGVLVWQLRSAGLTVRGILRGAS
jgi:transcriptional regulator with GAF, ATPase, and Fis domain